MREKIKEQVMELAKIGREEYDREMNKFGSSELAECVGKNKIWQALPDMLCGTGGAWRKEMVECI